jgi:hypothetical protein
VCLRPHCLLQQSRSFPIIPRIYKHLPTLLPTKVYSFAFCLEGQVFEYKLVWIGSHEADLEVPWDGDYATIETPGSAEKGIRLTVRA